MRFAPLTAVAIILTAGSLLAGEPAVLNVAVVKTTPTRYNFSVTVRHADTGREHYAGKWEALDGSQHVLTTNILYHPHVDEQPFTRSLSEVTIPAAVRDVNIRAHCSVHGYGDQESPVHLPQ